MIHDWQGKVMNQKTTEQAKEPDMASSFNAIRRAAKRARQIAATWYCLVVRHGEQVKRITERGQNTPS